MKRALPFVVGLVIVLLAIAAVPVAAVASAFIGNLPVPDRDERDGVTLVKDGYVTAYVLDAGPGQVVLIDCGMAPGAVATELKSRGLTEDAVTAIFLTHAHGDHAGGCKAFPKATVYALAAELPLLHGEVAPKGPLPALFGADDQGVKGTALVDGQNVTVGTLDVTTFAVPGHTAGSAVYLADQALFFGDSASSDSSGGVKPAPWVFTDDTATNRASLVALSARMDKEGATVRRMYFGHTGPVEGSDALRSFAAAR